MPAPRKSTRSRIVEAARQLFWLRGYAATSINDILAEAQANSGSFYHLFKSKEQLLLTIIRNHTAAFQPGIVDPAYKIVDHPFMRVIGIMRHYRQNLFDSDFACGCPAGKLALAIPLDQPLLLGALDECFRNWRAAVEKCLRDMRDDLPRNTDYRRLASIILSLVQGAIIQCRIARNIEPFDDAIQIFALHIEDLMNARYWEIQDEKREARRKKRAALRANETEPSAPPLDASACAPTATPGDVANEHPQSAASGDGANEQSERGLFPECKSLEPQSQIQP
jgi:TetR/AcrR family transcriptional repressor of lmrAB and yxaGH operons